MTYDVAHWWATSNPLTVSNALSFARLLGGPAFVSLLLAGHDSTALALLIAAGWSDWADGYYAKKYNQQSVLGTYLDPLADKVFLLCAVGAMGYAGYLPAWLVAVSMGRDAALLGGAFALRAHELGGVRAVRSVSHFFNVDTSDGTAAKPLEPHFVSKVNTVLQLALVLAAMTEKALDFPPAFAVDALGYGMTATSLASLAIYAQEGSVRAAEVSARSRRPSA